MTVKITSDISVTDIPALQYNDYSIYRKKVAPIISSNEYKRWILTDGVKAVVARSNKEIIGQMWAHPIKIFQNGVLLKQRFFWVHNIKVHPSWQNKGIFRQIEEYYRKKLLSEEVHRFFLIESKNTRMRLLANKLKLFPGVNVSGAVLFRYFTFPRIKKPKPLEIVKSHTIPKLLRYHVKKHKKYWVPHFSWDTSPEWFSFYFRKQLICILQVSRPIHPTQGRFIHKFPILLKTLQIRYLSIPFDEREVQPSITRSIFTTLFHTYPQINTLVFTLSPSLLSQFLGFPKFLFFLRKFILYSTTNDPDLIQNNLDFHSSFILLNDDKG
ncbi:MAG: GNAT family N-acetyltransferase [Candidatus Heimdallarchaeota archaeon]|nr:MAG: GNAT family N-acetyltransferase [Candidatus Heimdallarchaeota archaeon]